MLLLIFSYQSDIYKLIQIVILKGTIQSWKLIILLFCVQKCIPGHLHTFSEILYDKYWPVKQVIFKYSEYWY